MPLMYRFRTSAILAAIIYTTGLSAYAQAPRLIGHQGLLTNAAGIPVLDASRSMTFTLYDKPTAGTPQWTETKSVATVGGVFNTNLGDATPLETVSFSDSLWLGVKVESDAEILPRTLLTSAPAALSLAMPFKSRFELHTADLGTDDSEQLGEELTIHATDALAGLYSTDAGSFGSGLIWGEVNGGVLTDKWSAIRMTSSQASELRFTYGPGFDHGLNPTRVTFDTVGVITAKAFAYSEPVTGYVSIHPTAFELDNPLSSSTWASGTDAFVGTGVNSMSAPATLPHGATIKEVTCFLVDLIDPINLSCKLLSLEFTTLFLGSTLSSVETSGSSGLSILSDTSISDDVVDNSTKAYSVMVSSEGGNWQTAGNLLSVRHIIIRYELDRTSG